MSNPEVSGENNAYKQIGEISKRAGKEAIGALVSAAFRLRRENISEIVNEDKNEEPVRGNILKVGVVTVIRGIRNAMGNEVKAARKISKSTLAREARDGAVVSLIRSAEQFVRSGGLSRMSPKREQKENADW